MINDKPEKIMPENVQKKKVIKYRKTNKHTKKKHTIQFVAWIITIDDKVKQSEKKKKNPNY